MRMKVTRLCQQLAPSHPREPLSRKNQGDLLTGSRKVLETGTRLVGRSYAHDAVMPRVAVAQLSLEGPQCTRILVDGDKHGARHGMHSSAAPAYSDGEPTRARINPHGLVDASGCSALGNRPERLRHG